MFLNKIRIVLIANALILLIGIQTSLTAQTPPADSANDTHKTQPANSDVCDQRLAKVLADLDATDIQIRSRDGQILNLENTVKLQEERFQKVLQLLYDFANVEKQDKKSWWKKTKKVLGELVKGITNPETIRLILLAIAVIESRD